MSTTPAQKPDPMTEATWEEFHASGLFWWINRSLHLFGWCLVREMEGDALIRVFPARCRFRGFARDVEESGFEKLTRHLRDNADELVRQVEED